MCCGLTKYGLREVVVATIAAAGLCALSTWLLWGAPWALYPAAAVIAGLWLFVVMFFRDPARQIPREHGLLVSPADGRVADVTNVGPESPLGCDGVKIGIFMSVFDVHVNRSPCDGRVKKIERQAGTFLDARDPHASERNESATIRLTHSHGRLVCSVVVRQIAGLIARRIVTDLTEAQTVTRGQRIGMIKFGSRVEVLVPDELVGTVQVQVGNRVRAGQTVLIAAEKEQAQP